MHDASIEILPLFKRRIWKDINLDRYLERALTSGKIEEIRDIACYDSVTTKVCEGTFTGKFL